MEAIAVLPVLDLNTLNPEEGTIKLDKDTINIRSSDIAMQIVTAITDGLINPLDFMVKKKLVIDALEMAAKNPQVKAVATEEMEKYGKESVSRLGAKLSVTSRATYQYEADPTWKSIAEEMKPLMERLKAQEEKIKAACKNNCSLVDEEGTIIASIVPHPKTESIAVSFSKK